MNAFYSANPKKYRKRGDYMYISTTNSKDHMFLFIILLFLVMVLYFLLMFDKIFYRADSFGFTTIYHK